MPFSFDAQPCSESEINDLALSQFDAYRREAVDVQTIAANHRPLEQQLASLLVNRFGYGVQRAQALLVENGNPPAEFQFDEHSMLLRISKRA